MLSSRKVVALNILMSPLSREMKMRSDVVTRRVGVEGSEIGFDVSVPGRMGWGWDLQGQSQHLRLADSAI